MKKLSTCLFLILFGFSAHSFAEDISEYQIEGISIGDSLLDFFSRKEIIDNINSESTFEYKDRKFVQIGTSKNSFEIYEIVGLIIKPNDKDFIIYGISGQFSFGDEIEKCYTKQNTISKDIDDLVGENTKKIEWDAKYKQDATGKSKVKYIDYQFKDSSEIRIICYDMSKDFHDPNDALYVAVNSIEFSEFLINL